MPLERLQRVFRAGGDESTTRREGRPDPASVGFDGGRQRSADHIHRPPACRWRPPMTPARRLRRSDSLARKCRRACSLTSPLASSTRSIRAGRPNCLAYTSRAIRRMRLRTVAFPAVLPSATISRPLRSGAFSAQAVSGPDVARIPSRRSRRRAARVASFRMLSH